MPTYRMKLTMLSPVHVGSGEEIEPTEYVVREERHGDLALPFLYAIDLPRLLGRLTDQQRRDFNYAADRGGILYLRKFIDKTADLARDLRWKTACNEELCALYRKGLDSDRAQLIINLMTREAVTGRPYLPGSSIKGALRTAWVSRKAAQYAAGGARPEPREREFEAEVLGYRARDDHGRYRDDIRADPFRAVHVGDAPLCDDSNTVEPVEIYKPDRHADQPDPSGIRMFYDMTFARLYDEDITAEGRLAVDERLAATRADVRRGWMFDHCVADAVTADALLEACNKFYRPRLIDEIERFPRLQGSAKQLLTWADQMHKGEALLRLGRFSHRECVTVSPNGGPPARKGTTRSLACSDLPLGWAKITLVPQGC